MTREVMKKLMSVVFYRPECGCFRTVVFGMKGY